MPKFFFRKTKNDFFEDWIFEYFSNFSHRIRIEFYRFSVKKQQIFCYFVEKPVFLSGNIKIDVCYLKR